MATGVVIYGKQGEFCHNLKLYEDERKIRVEEIFDPNCPIPDRPQGDDNNILGDIQFGEWVVWPVSRMEFLPPIVEQFD